MVYLLLVQGADDQFAQSRSVENDPVNTELPTRTPYADDVMMGIRAFRRHGGKE